MLLTVVATAMILLPSTSGTIPRILFGLPLLIFLPGYALVSVAYTKSNSETSVLAGGRSSGDASPGRSIDGYTRIGLSIASSLAIVAMVAYLLNFTQFGIRPVPTLVAVSGLTIVLTVVAVWRRRSVSPAERFSVNVPAVRIRGPTGGQTLLNVVIVLGLVFALSATGYALSASSDQAGQESFTEFSLLSENETGEYVANGYPSELTSGEATEFAVGITNHEQVDHDYTVVVLLQRTDESGEILEREEVTRFQASVGEGQTEIVPHTVTPTSVTGEDVELVYLLYLDDPPASPTPENSYRDLRLHVFVSENVR
nr:DUF1616 domain-containing protein [Haloferax sp. CBA1149]